MKLNSCELAELLTNKDNTFDYCMVSVLEKQKNVLPFVVVICYFSFK